MSDLEAQLGEFVRGIVRDELRRALREHENRSEHITIKAYAAQRSISVGTVRNAIRDGRLPAIKVGRAVRVRADVEIGTPKATGEGTNTVEDSLRAETLRILGVTEPHLTAPLKRTGIR